jgi:Sec-independent protein translocase protein TatA
MFGVSFPELIIVIILFLLVVNPKDIPAIARYITKIVMRAKNIIAAAKEEVKKTSKELGIDEVRDEVMAQIKKEEEELRKTTIIDIYGNSHEVHNIDEIRGDLAKEDLQEEIEKQNEINKKPKSVKKKKLAKKVKKS